MSEAEVTTKKWGSSLGVVIPKNVVEKEHLRENEKIKIDFKNTHTAKKIWGLMSGLKVNPQKAKNEMRESWND